MIDRILSARRAQVFGLAILGSLGLAACAQYVAPQQVQTTNPTVTYKYQNDADLVQASQKAASFCTPYQSTPRNTSISNDADGSKIAVFECVRTAPQVVAAAPRDPNLTYVYRTDQELIDASRNAQAYCASNGSQQAVSTMGTDANGTKIVTFRCSPVR